MSSVTYGTGPPGPAGLADGDAGPDPQDEDTDPDYDDDEAGEDTGGA